MAWPPVTHADVKDEVATARGYFQGMYRPGFYYSGAWTGMSANPINLVAGSLYLRPYLVQARQAFDRLGIQVTTAASAGGTIQLGIYRPVAGLPSALVAATTAMDSTIAGVKEGAISVTLDPGIYWIGAKVAVAGCTVPVVVSGEHSTPYMHWATNVLSANPATSLSTASAEAGMPDPLPGPFTSGSNFVQVGLRAA